MAKGEQTKVTQNFRLFWFILPHLFFSGQCCIPQALCKRKTKKTLRNLVFSPEKEAYITVNQFIFVEEWNIVHLMKKFSFDSESHRCIQNMA